MYGPHMNKQYNLAGRPHCSDPNLYIFVAHDDKYYKMTAVSRDNAKASTNPSTPVDKYIQSMQNNIAVDNSTILCKMWEGNGYRTTRTIHNAYELKDVTYTGCGLYIIPMCPYMYKISEHAQSCIYI